VVHADLYAPRFALRIGHAAGLEGLGGRHALFHLGGATLHPAFVVAEGGLIDALVQESMERRREASQLLKEAKKTVEDMIAGQSAQVRE
jgi:hypothetical protein